MAINSLIKVLSGASAVTKDAAQNCSRALHQGLENHITKGNYVSREEFESLKKMVLELDSKLKAGKKNNK
jgi:BMFP domain-containing protein YqiC